MDKRFVESIKTLRDNYILEYNLGQRPDYEYMAKDRAIKSLS